MESNEEIQNLASCGYFNDFSKEDLDLFAFNQICGGCYYCALASNNEERHRICKQTTCSIKRGRWQRINNIRSYIERYYKKKNENIE